MEQLLNENRQLREENTHLHGTVAAANRKVIDLERLLEESRRENNVFRAQAAQGKPIHPQQQLMMRPPPPPAPRSLEYPRASQALVREEDSPSQILAGRSSGLKPSLAPVPAYTSGYILKVEWQRKWDVLLDETAAWTKAHISDSPGCPKLPKELEDDLARLCARGMLPGLLEDGRLRQWVVVRLLLTTMTNEALTPRVLQDFIRSRSALPPGSLLANFASVLGNVQDRWPGTENWEGVFQLSRTFCSLRNDVNSSLQLDAFFRDRARETGQGLLQKLAPLLGTGGGSVAAMRILRGIIVRAHFLCADIVAMPCTFRFDQHSAGHNAFYKQDTMTSVDDPVRGDLDILRRGDFRVRMGVSPVVMITSRKPDGITTVPTMTHTGLVLLYAA